MQFGQFMIDSNVLYNYSLRFFDYDLCRILGIVCEIQKREIVIRYDKMRLPRVDHITPAIADKN